MKKHECQMMIELVKMNRNHDLMKVTERRDWKREKKKERKERYDRLFQALENGKAFEIIAEAIAKKIYEPLIESAKTKSSKTEK